MSAGCNDGSFNPTRIARLETTAWTAYYRHDWPRVLAASYGLVQEAFNLTLVGTVLGVLIPRMGNRLLRSYRSLHAAVAGTAPGPAE